MKKLKIISSLLLMILIFGCGKKVSDLEFEKETMLQIYPALIDSIWIKDQVATHIMASKYALSENLDSKELNKKYNQQLTTMKQDTSKLYVLASNKIYPANENDCTMLSKYFKKITVNKNLTDSLNYAIDENEFSAIKHIKTKFISKFDKKKLFDQFKNRFYTHGILSFSRIQFDSEKKYGLLAIEITSSAFSAHSYIVFIKKVNGIWIIDKFEENWIS